MHRHPVYSQPVELPDEPTTEAINADWVDLDRLDARQIVRLMNDQDVGVVRVVGEKADDIANVIDAVANRLESGGRLFYIGAGTSGRLGILDASECPPTFDTAPDLVQGLIAGGDEAIRTSVEGAEDSSDLGARDLRVREVSARDAVAGIAASGSTPYVLGAVRYASEVGAYTAAITCNQDSELAALVDGPIPVIVGPEILAGSTRLKAGTATKMVLNMISTGVMVRLGKTYGNLMVDLRASNRKLTARTQRLLRRLTSLDAAEAESLLARCDGELKTSVVAARLRMEPAAARRRLAAHRGALRAALEAPPFA